MKTKEDEEKPPSSHSSLQDETDQQAVVDTSTTNASTNIIDWNGQNDPERPINWS